MFTSCCFYDMANVVPDLKPVSTVVSVRPEGEMDALLLGRTRVS